MVPSGHEHAPPTHSWPFAHRFPHVPQCSGESSGTGTPSHVRQSSTRPLQSSSRRLSQTSARGEAHPQTRALKPSGSMQPQPEGHDAPSSQAAVQTERSVSGIRRQSPEVQSSVVRQGSPKSRSAPASSISGGMVGSQPTSASVNRKLSEIPYRIEARSMFTPTPTSSLAASCSSRSKCPHKRRRYRRIDRSNNNPLGPSSSRRRRMRCTTSHCRCTYARKMTKSSPTARCMSRSWIGSSSRSRPLGTRCRQSNP